jgi:hypothetical protein
MLINTDLSSDTLALSPQQKRLEPSGAASQTSPAIPPSSTASQLDPLLQRLTEAPARIEDGDMEVQDESSAMQVMNSLLQGMRSQPGTAMSAQANQLSENVLSLLQPAD